MARHHRPPRHVVRHYRRHVDREVIYVPHGPVIVPGVVPGVNVGVTPNGALRIGIGGFGIDLR
jgi:hypothetical protein